MATTGPHTERLLRCDACWAQTQRERQEQGHSVLVEPVCFIAPPPSKNEQVFLTKSLDKMKSTLDLVIEHIFYSYRCV